MASAAGCDTSVLVSELRRPEVRMDHGVQSLNFELQTEAWLSLGRLVQRLAMKMGSSSSEAGDEDRINDGVRSDVGVVVVDLADAGSTALAHNRKRAHGEFPWAHTHGWTEGDPLAQKGKRQCNHCKKWFSSKTNCSRWKAHLSSKHSLSRAGSDTASSAPGSDILVQTMLKPVSFPNHVIRKYENDVVDFVIGGDISLRAAGGKQFKELLQSLTNGYSPLSTRTILRRIMELYLIARPLLAAFFSSLNVAISLTLDGWSNRNLKGFYVVTTHWIDTVTAKSKSLLLTIIDVASGRGVGVHVAKALFEHLKGMGLNMLPKLLNVMSNNGSDATVAVKHMFQLINATVRYEQMRPCNHVRCADHSVQLVVLKVLVWIKDINAQLRQTLVCIHRSKTMRQAYHRKADLAGFPSKEPPHQDCPTRWNLTHEMGSDAFSKRVPLDHIMNLYNDTIGIDVLFDEKWERIAAVTAFLCPPRQVMELLAADRKTSLDLVSASITHLIKHCENGETTYKDTDQDLTTAGMKAKL